MTDRPLQWPERWRHPNQYDRLLSDVPVLGLNARVHRNICGQLKSRSIACFGLWGEDVDCFHTLCFLSPIVKEYGRWPNCYFIPDDPCAILFFDPTSVLLAAEAVCKIHEELSLPAEMLDDLDALTYGDLVDRLTQFIKSNPKNRRELGRDRQPGDMLPIAAM